MQKLSAAEISGLWVSYMVDSMAVCCLGHFLKKCEDEDVAAILRYARHLSERHVATVAELFRAESIPVPVGFTDRDANVDAPRLFSDEFVLLYLHQLSNQGMAFYAKMLAVVAREDVHRFYMECSASSIELNANTKKALLTKGLYVRPPYAPVADHAEMVEGSGFLRGFLGERRPLSVLEIMNCFYNLQTTEIVKTLLLGFAQVAETKAAKDFFGRGRLIAQRQADWFRSTLSDEDLSAASPWNTYVSDSTTSPFSDKLMLFHLSVLTGAGIEQYGFCLSTSMRRDLGAKYAQLLAEMVTYNDDAAKLMIERGWMEQPPLIVDREALQPNG